MIITQFGLKEAMVLRVFAGAMACEGEKAGIEIYTSEGTGFEV